MGLLAVVAAEALQTPAAVQTVMAFMASGDCTAVAVLMAVHLASPSVQMLMPVQVVRLVARW